MAPPRRHGAYGVAAGRNPPEDHGPAGDGGGALGPPGPPSQPRDRAGPTRGESPAAAAGLRPAFLPPFYASLLAQACTLGVEHMAHVTDLAYDHWAWCTPWYLRADTLKAAGMALVHSHPHLPLSQHGGSGMLSSSDGQRFPVSGKTRHARRMPPPLGYGIGITFSRWSADQLSQ